MRTGKRVTGFLRSREWQVSGKHILICRYLGTTPDSSSLLPLLTSICQQLSYTFILPFEDIPDDVVPLTGYLKELLTLASAAQPILICLDSVDQIVGATDGNRMTWLPLRLPPTAKLSFHALEKKKNLGCAKITMY